MNTYVSRGLLTVLVTGGFLALGAGVAHADTGTSGGDGVASGTQGILGIQLPISLGGNSISIFGNASSTDAATTAPSGSGGSTGTTSGSGGILGGTQLLADLGLPITLGGNSISVFGDASSSGASSAASSSAGASGAGGHTAGAGGILSGTQVLPELGIPVTLGGNAISVFGNASSSGASTAAGGSGTGSAAASTTGTHSLLGGSQVGAGFGVPVTLGGNAISLLGTASSTGASTAPGAAGVAGQAGVTGGLEGLLGGTQLFADLGLPVTLGGNAISLLGDATTGGATTVGDPGDGPVDVVDTDPGDPSDPGTDASDPGTDPDDDGDQGVVVAAAGDTSGLAATGADASLAIIGFAGLLLGAGALMLRRIGVRRS